MIWIVVYIVAGLVGLVALMAIIGLFLPRDHVSVRSATITAPPERVWAWMVDDAGQPRWKSDVPVVVVERVAPTKLVTRIADEKLPFGGTWTIDVAPEGASSKVTVTEDGFVKNPVFRFLSKTVFSLSSTQEKWLRDLQSGVGPAQP
jgi:hypothetical protein